MSKCKARRIGDQMHCNWCKVQWDNNDQDRPSCPFEPRNERINWQLYERIETGEVFRFKKLRNGRYAREDGMELNVVQLNHYYQWKRREACMGPRMKHETNINGFKVRQYL